MADASAGIDIVITESGTDQFLNYINFFIGAT